ncbi:MAG: restriction endonuclease subunit S, partial [Vulcanimicrobiota bacterium]
MSLMLASQGSSTGDGSSGVGWERIRLKYLAEVNPGKAKVNDGCLATFAPMEALAEWGGLDLSSTRPASEVSQGYTSFRDGDVLFAKITPCFENGKCALATGLENGVGYGTTELHVLRRREDIENRWLFYVILGHEFRGFGEGSMYGAGGQKRVPPEFVENYKALVPPLPTQKAIANFLDRKTASIDALIEKKEKLLELLAEKRTALINQAVTKGLDPNVPMKDSGIPWIEEIPEHWETLKVKRLTRILRGKFSHRPRNDPRFYGGSYPFLQTGEVARAKRTVEGYSQTLNEKGFSVSKEFPAGTLLMVITGAKTGHTAILGFDACFPDSVVGFVPEQSVDRDYLYEVFQAMQSELLRVAIVSTQENLNVERIGDLYMPCPPLIE